MLKVLSVNIYKTIAKNKAKCRNLSITVFNQQKDATEVQEQHPPPSVILVEKDTNITLIGLNRPHKRNAIDAATAQLLSEALHAFEEDADSPVAVLYGVGGSFCAGHDLVELQEQSAENFLLRREGSIGPTRRHLRKPLVCGISGYCVGSGLELALLSDLRVMEDTAVLGCFQRRLGVPLSDGGTVRLAAAVGYSRALDLITTGRRVGAKEALEIGLINRLVATGTALGQAVSLAFSVAKYPQASLKQDREGVYDSVYERRGFNAAVQREVMQTSAEVLSEMHEGLQRFRNSELKGPKTDSWHIKEKSIPDWEKIEISREILWSKLHKK